MDLTTAQIHAKLERMRGGDAAAADELLRGVGVRLENLTRRMLRSYPRVRRWADTDDVLQNAVIRLIRALRTITPPSTRDFFNLAAVQIRRELVDLARHYAGPRGAAPHFAAADDSAGIPQHPAAPTEPDLETWAQFHLEVDRLPAREREVVNLVYYHGWQQEKVAELFAVDVRTVRRWWNSALVKLHEVFKEMLEP